MKALFVSYNGALESLGQSQIIPYLREIRRDGHEMVLLTYERGGDHVSSDAHLLREELQRDGICWYWLRYHKRPPVVSTLWNVLCGIPLILYIVLRHKVSALHARSHVAAAMAWPVVKLLGKPFIFDLRGQMAEEYADGGTWKRGGLLYRLVAKAERLFIKDADETVVLTQVLATDVRPLTRRPPTVVPTCVDLALYHHSDLQQDDVPRMIYCGSLGARYGLSLLSTCFREARGRFPDLKLQVLTHSEQDRLREELARSGVPSLAYEIRRVPHREVPRYLARAAMGVLLLQGHQSLRGACPTKVGEYLAAGLPVLCSPGIGDCQEQLEGNRVGVILKGHDPGSFREGLNRMAELLAEGPGLRGRCRLVAEKEFSLAGRGGPAYRALYRNLQGRR